MIVFASFDNDYFEGNKIIDNMKYYKKNSVIDQITELVKVVIYCSRYEIFVFAKSTRYYFYLGKLGRMAQISKFLFFRLLTITSDCIFNYF